MTLKRCAPSPPFPNSAMDGYALRSDTPVLRPRHLKWSANPPQVAPSRAQPGEAVRIFTGAAHGRRRRHHRHSDVSQGERIRLLRQETICVRPEWTFRQARSLSQPVTDGPGGRGAGRGGKPRRLDGPPPRPGRHSGDRR